MLEIEVTDLIYTLGLIVNLSEVVIKIVELVNASK